MLPLLFGLGCIGFLGAFRLPPVDNLLRLAPVLNVTDNRRLGLWVAFSVSLLGGVGLDSLQEGFTLGKRWRWGIILAAAALLFASAVIVSSESTLRRHAEAHYREAAQRESETDPTAYQRRADRRVRAAVEFLPRYYTDTAGGLLIMAGLMAVARFRPGPNRWLPASILLLNLADLARFGVGLNPAIDREIQNAVPKVIEHLKRELSPGDRVIGVGAEFPPNVLMRFGIGDPRNYDSIELTRNLDWFAPLFEDAEGAMTSRRTINWMGVDRARDRLESAGVAAIVGVSPPPVGLFQKCERVGEVWVARLDAKPWACWRSGRPVSNFSREPGRIFMPVEALDEESLIVRETWDQGWTATVDGSPIPVDLHQGTFLELRIPAGSHNLILEYNPVSMRIGLAVSAASLAIALGILALTRIRRY
jgi:hypothetical protein